MAKEEVAFIPYEELAPEQKAMVDSFFTYRRVEAAERGLGLDKLVADKKPAVRLEVAEHEYGLDKLFKDPDPLVAEAAERCLGVLTLKEWIDQNPDRCVIFWNKRPIWTPEQLTELKALEEKRLRIAESIDASYDPFPAHPSYTAEELIAMLSECDDVAYVTYWTREDIVNEVESLGFDPNTNPFVRPHLMSLLPMAARRPKSVTANCKMIVRQLLRRGVDNDGRFYPLRRAHA